MLVICKPVSLISNTKLHLIKKKQQLELMLITIVELMFLCFQTNLRLIYLLLEGHLLMGDLCNNLTTKTTKLLTTGQVMQAT
jgi:hypothetical protein